MTSTYSDFKNALAIKESGGNGDFQAENERGYIGRYQFSEQLLDDIGFYNDANYNNDWTGEWETASGVTSKDQFLGKGIYNDPVGQTYAIERQEAALEAEFQLNASRISAGLDGWWVYEGQVLNGHLITMSGMLAYAHIGGYGALTAFLKSGGTYEARDGNNTSYVDYLDDFAGYDTPYAVDHGGDETRRSGFGDDVLTGGAGDDTYIFKPGGGIDTLHDSGNENKILLLNASSNVSLTTDIAHEDLQISYTGGITTIEGQ